MAQLCCKQSLDGRWRDVIMHIMESPVEGVKRAFAGFPLDADKIEMHSANKQ